MDVVHREKPFSWAAFLVSVMAAFLVGQVLGEWLPANMHGRDGLLMVAGTSAYPILVMMQEKVRSLVRGGPP